MLQNCKSYFLSHQRLFTGSCPCLTSCNKYLLDIHRFSFCPERFEASSFRYELPSNFNFSISTAVDDTF